MTLPNTAIQLEQLIRELNDPRNQGVPDRIYELQKQIQQLQRTPSAWQAGLDLLDHAESQMRFYGALTLTIKVNTDWENDKVGEDRDSLRGLLQRLISSYARLAAAGDATFVVQKLCTTLVAVFQKNDSAWALPVRHILACIVAGSYVDQSQVPRLQDLLAVKAVISALSLRAVLLLAQILAEESGNTSSTSRSHNLQTRMSNNCSDIWQVLQFSTASLLDGTVVPSDGHRAIDRLTLQGTTEQMVDIGNIILQTAPYWTSDIKTNASKVRPSDTMEMIDRFQIVVEGFLQLYQQKQLTVAVVQAFTTFEQTSHSLLHRAAPDYAGKIVTSEQALLWVKTLIDGDFDPDAIAYVDFLEALMSQVDVTTSDYLRKPQHIEILEQVQRLLSCNGTAGTEDLVCHIALEILSPIVEGFGDWERPTPFDASIIALVTASCSACLTKIRMPPEEMSMSTQSWDSDDRAKFQDFRFDVQDYLQNAFAILGGNLVEEIVRSLIASEHKFQWHIFEANLFGLMAFADTMAGEPDTYDQYLEVVFQCRNWTSAMDRTQNLPERVRQMIIKLLGEATGFLQRHTQYLVSSLNFLFEALHTSALATLASRAIFTLCDAQRSMLTETLPQFIASLNNVADLEPDARNRIFGGVSAIIQALPTEVAKLEPLSHVLLLVENDVQNFVAATTDIHEFRKKAGETMYTLAAIGKGLRAPQDTPDDLDPAPASNVDFWTQGPGSITQQSTLRIYSVLQDKIGVNEDSGFVEATCEFLRSTFTEDHPSPFKFLPETVVPILFKYIDPAVLQPDLVMGTVSSYLASADIKNPSGGFVILSSSTIRICQNAITQFKTSGVMQIVDFCAAALEFYARLLPKWGKVWLSTPTYQDDARFLLETTLILMNDSDTLTRRSATTFCVAFFEASARSYIASDQEAATKMNISLQEYSPRLLASLIHLLGGECARSELDTIAEPLKRSVQKQPLIANRLIKEAMKAESGVLSAKALAATKPELRARVASQIEMLRGARKTNEIVKDFWIACRGSSFGYVV